MAHSEEEYKKLEENVAFWRGLYEKLSGTFDRLLENLEAHDKEMARLNAANEALESEAEQERALLRRGYCARLASRN